MREIAKYVNSNGDVVNFGTFPYFLSSSDLRDYAWNYESTNDMITSFTKAVSEKELPIYLIDDDNAEDAKNRIYEVFEQDVLNKKKGKLYIGDYYLLCNVVSSSKSNYLKSRKYVELSFKIVTDYPWWIREKTHIFPSSIIDFEDYAVSGYTNNDLVSIAEDGSFIITATTVDGDVHSGTVESIPLCSLFELTDMLYLNADDDLVVQKNVESTTTTFTEDDIVINGDYVTFKKSLPLGKEGNGLCKCVTLTSNVKKIPDADFSDRDYQEGTDIVSTLSDDSVCYIEIEGNDAGVSSFTLTVIDCTNTEFLNNNSWTVLGSMTWDGLSAYQWTEISLENMHVLDFSLDNSMVEGESIKMDSDGVWKIFRLDGSVEVLDDTKQEELSNLPSFNGYTHIYTSNIESRPNIKATFKSHSYIINKISNTEYLQYPMEEFIVIEDGYVYVRKQEFIEDFDVKYIYSLLNPYIYYLNAEANTFLNSILLLDDIKEVVVTDESIVNNTNTSFYPHDYPYGYKIGVLSEKLNNDVLKDASFILKIYGKANDPDIVINDHHYKVVDTIQKGEYVTINTFDKTITLHHADGSEENIFNKRFKEQSIFEKLQAGLLEIDWSRNFGFDLTILEERGEPKWT